MYKRFLPEYAAEREVANQYDQFYCNEVWAGVVASVNHNKLRETGLGEAENSVSVVRGVFEGVDSRAGKEAARGTCCEYWKYTRK